MDAQATRKRAVSSLDCLTHRLSVLFRAFLSVEVYWRPNVFQFIARDIEISSNENVDALYEAFRETRLAKLVDPPLQGPALMVTAPRDV